MSSAATPPQGAAMPVRAADAPAPGTDLGVHYRMCFGCGDEHPTGLHLSVVAGADLSVHARFQVTDLHQGAAGLAHGGLLSLAFDEAMGFLLWLLMKRAVTAHLEVDFVEPVPVGSEMFIDAECVAVDGRKIYMRAEGHLGSQDGPLAVRASSLYVEVPLEHFTSRSEEPPPAVWLEADRSYNP